MEHIRLQAPAKINLFLKVLGQRSDGYHDLATLMQKVDLYDEIQLVRKKTGISLTCPGSDLPENSQNIVYKAAELFIDRFSTSFTSADQGVDIVLKKKIPVAAGLGGGSSDAAAVLRGMEAFFLPSDYPQDELFFLARQLGADVPFCLSRYSAAWATGIGDELQPAVSLTDYTLVLINPGILISTQWVYETFALTCREKIFNLNNFSISKPPFLRRNIRVDELVNDLETVTARRFKEIETIKKHLLVEGAVAAMMSGSGSTVFGLFEEAGGKIDAIEKCFERLRKQYRNVFIVRPL